MQTGLRAWVERQTHHPLGYVEQLYTFADRNRAEAGSGRRIVSISYLGLTREREPGWQSWYRYFPWENWREGPPKLLARAILPRLERWVGEGRDPAAKRERRQRVEGNFDARAWNEDLGLQRYELFYEARQDQIPDGRVRAEAAGLHARPFTEPNILMPSFVELHRTSAAVRTLI